MVSQQKQQWLLLTLFLILVITLFKVLQQLIEMHSFNQVHLAQHIQWLLALRMDNNQQALSMVGQVLIAQEVFQHLPLEEELAVVVEPVLGKPCYQELVVMGQFLSFQ
jgi:hypothetical protein